MAAGSTEGRARRILARLRGLRKRSWIAIGAAAALMVAGGATAAVLLTQQSSAQAAPVTQTVAAALETLEKSVTATGTLSPKVQEEVSFAASGTVTSVPVQAGDTVQAGQTLATVDELTANAELLQARADLATAQANLASAQTDSDGTAASTARIAAREAAVTVAEQSVATAETALAGVTLTAPVAGLVTAVNIAVGDAVTGTSSSSGSGSSGGSSPSGTGQSGSAGSSSTSTSTAAFTIVSTDSWSVAVSLGETEIGLVDVDDQVELETDDGTQLFGVVAEVGKLPATSSGSAAYPVTIDITGETEGLFDGTSVTATIVYERRNEVLTVPSAAVTTAEDGSATVTLVDEAGNESEQAVTVGETSGDLTEITEGLAEGDLVLVTVFTPGSGNAGAESGAGAGGTTGGENGFPGGGEMPDFSQMPSGGMPSGTGGGFPGGQQ